METNKIPPKSAWSTLSILQLYEVKGQMADTYYNMRRISASFAPQYLKFLSEIDALIRTREAAEKAEREDQG